MDNNFSVLILFFANPQRLNKVFEQVRKAKPNKLFLYQDGAREGKNDEPGIEACRKIVENIDWPCEVHRWYQEKNVGCDPSEFLSQKWAFSFVDKCIILEDDDVPTQSFFRFCSELLDKYEFDERISMIAGMNHEGITEGVPYDYFFTSNVSIWGWATWKRVIDKWDEHYSFMNDPVTVELLQDKLSETNYRNDFWPLLKWHSESGIAYYETIMMTYMLLESGLSIVPTKNMILNIGYDGGTHNEHKFEKLPPYLKRLYSLPTYELDGNLSHPPYVIENYSYKKRIYKLMEWNEPKTKQLIKRIIRHFRNK